MEYELLIIDDDEVFLHMHEQLLLKNGLEKSPIKFDTCSEALEYISAHYSTKKKFFVLLDIYMDGMNGWDFMDQLFEKNLSKNTSVVIVTSSINLHDHIKSDQYTNISAYIEKPFSKDHLKKLIEETELKEFLQ